MVKKSALIISPQGVIDVAVLERNLLAKGFHTVRVKTLSETFFRLENERFSVVLCEDAGDGNLHKRLGEGLLERPFAATTPVVLLGNGPQPLDRSALTSLLDQYFPVETKPEELADFANEIFTLQIEKAKRGKLGPISIPQLLYSATKFHLDGAIVVERPEEKCIIYLENGNAVFASSNRDENRFGEFLVQQGLITQEQFIRAAKQMQHGNKRLGRILVDEGYLKPQVLRTLIQSQVKHIIYTVFDWKDGEYYILFEERSGQDEPIARFDTARLILEGVRFKFGEGSLAQEFEPFDQKVSLALSLEECQRRAALGKNELDFLRLIGKGRSMDDLLHLNSFSRLESLKLLFSFRTLGFLAFEKEAAIAPQKADLTTDERSKTMDALFAQKDRATSPVVTIETEPLPTAVVRGRSRAWKVAYMSAGAGALAITLIVSTLVETRFSRKGDTKDLGSTLVELDPEVRRLKTESLEGEIQQPTFKIETKKSPITEIADPVIDRSETATEPDAMETSVKEKVKPERAAPTLKKIPGEKIVRVDPNAQYLAALKTARKYRDEGDLDQALQYFRKAVRLNPRHSGVALELGDLLFDLNRVTEAEKAYGDAKRLDPSNPRAYLALGTMYLVKKEKTKAAVEYEKYLAVAPNTTKNQARIVEVQRILQSLAGSP